VAALGYVIDVICSTGHLLMVLKPRSTTLQMCREPNSLPNPQTDIVVESQVQLLMCKWEE
jgi:hypothetical protein